MTDIVSLLRDKSTTIALVGANNNPKKYGNVIYRDLKRKGYRVYPVNPGVSEVEGDRSYPSLAELPNTPTIVNFVVPPSVTLSILKQCLDMGLKNVWIQPGAENPEVLAYIQEHNFNYLANACIMVESRK